MTSEVLVNEGQGHQPVSDPNTPLVSVRDLEISFKAQNGVVNGGRGIDFDIYPGETVAIVGESGSGKSTTATALMNLLPGTGRISGGKVLIEGQDISKLSQREMANVRGHVIGYVPQDPMSNLNPVWSVGFQVREAIRANGLATSKKDVEARAIEVLKQAGLADAERRMKQFPHQFSGGMRQRVLIGIGLGANPKLLIADEPTSALDVTVQKTILDHIESLTQARGTAVLLITHDLGLAAERASKLIVMHQGKIVEAGPSRTLLSDPQHPYTKRLLAAAPSIASQRIGASAGVVSGQADLAAGDDNVVDMAQVAKTRHAEAEAHAGDAVVQIKDLTKAFS